MSAAREQKARAEARIDAARARREDVLRQIGVELDCAAEELPTLAGVGLNDELPAIADVGNRNSRAAMTFLIAWSSLEFGGDRLRVTAWPRQRLYSL